MTQRCDSPVRSSRVVAARQTLFGAFAGIDVPDHLRANVERHWENICALIDSLGKAGLDEAAIERSVAQVVASYQAELMHSMKILHRDACHARQ